MLLPLPQRDKIVAYFKVMEKTTSNTVNYKIRCPIFAESLNRHVIDKKTMMNYFSKLFMKVCAQLVHKFFSFTSSVSSAEEYGNCSVLYMNICLFSEIFNINQSNIDNC